MEESVAKVKFYGSWITYGGLAVIIGSILTFLIEFMRMVHIARFPGIRGDHANLQELEEQLNEIEREN